MASDFNISRIKKSDISMKLLNLKTKYILLIVLLYETIYILTHLILFPISEAFYITEITANIYEELFGWEWISNFINYGIFMWPLYVFCALFFSKKVREETIKLKDYLENKVDNKKFSKWNEQQYHKWTDIITGKFGVIAFFIGYFSSTTIIFIYFFPSRIFSLQYLIYHIIITYMVQGIAFGCVFWVIFLSFGTTKIISDFCKANLTVNPFDNDKVGGLKPLGNFALLNATNLSLQAVLIIIFWIFNNLAGFSDIITIIDTYIFIILGILASFIIFYYPIKNIHITLIKLKTEETKKVQHSYYDYYSSLDSVSGEERSKVLLNLLALQSVKNELNQFRDYPWDTMIFIKLFSTYLIPIVVFILSQIYGLSL